MSHKSNPRNPYGETGTARAGSIIARSTFWNVLGAGLPALLALITVPLLIHSIGATRFGVLTIAWVILGYFGLFDLGLGRATIKFLAEAFEHDRVTEGHAIFWTSLALNGFLGLLGAAIFAALSPMLVDKALNIPAELQAEALEAFYLVAWAVPLVTLTTVLRGVLEARHRFALLNALQIPTAALIQAAPLFVLPFSYSLTWLIGALVVSRLFGTVVFLVAALRGLESPLEGPFFLRGGLLSLFSYGGWITVTNIVGPVMVYADRLVIGSLFPMTAVAYYATPYEAVTRLLILPYSLVRTMFPIFSAEADARQRTVLYVSATKHLTFVLGPVVVALIVFAPELLELWISRSFAENSAVVLQILAVGVLATSLALVPFNLIQGLGRPDITAKFHVLELPFYLVFLWYGVQHWGIAGAAVAWTARALIDAILLFLYVQLTGRATSYPTTSTLCQSAAFTFLLLFIAWLIYISTTNLVSKAALCGALLTTAAFTAWWKLLNQEERKIVTATVRSCSRAALRMVGIRR